MTTLKALGLVIVATLSAQAADFGLGIHIRPDVNGYGFHVPIKHNGKFTSVVSVDYSDSKEDLSSADDSQEQDVKEYSLEYALYREVFTRGNLSAQAGFCLGHSWERASQERRSEGTIFRDRYERNGYHFGPRANIEYTFYKQVSVNWGVGLLYERKKLNETGNRLDLDGHQRRLFVDSNLSLRIYF